MAEYIERSALLEDIENVLVFSGRQGHLNPKQIGARMVVQRIRVAPAAEVAPVVHGRWEEKFFTNDRQRVCSVCHFTIRQPSYDKGETSLWNYCPNCGARMDGDPR